MNRTGDAHGGHVHDRPGTGPAAGTPVVERLDEAECLALISAGGVGRIAYSGRFGPVIIPVNYRLHDGAVVFRTALGGTMDEDLRTGISDAAYQVAFEIDELDPAAREGWSVLLQGAAYLIDSADERAALAQAGVDPWVGGERDLFVRIVPNRVTGRRIRHTGASN